MVFQSWVTEDVLVLIQKVVEVHGSIGPTHQLAVDLFLKLKQSSGWSPVCFEVHVIYKIGSVSSLFFKDGKPGKNCNTC